MSDRADGSARHLIHATAIVLGDRGLLIEGVSQSGKSTLALTLIDAALKGGAHAALVSDDLVGLNARSGRVEAVHPGGQEGRIEASGLGIVSRPRVEAALIDAVVRLVPEEAIVRMPDPLVVNLAGIDVPMLHLPQRQSERNRLILGDWLAQAGSIPPSLG